MNPHYALVALRARHRCEYCHAPEVIFNFPFEVEHILPLARGGPDTEQNWALACRACNLWKATHTTGLDPESQQLAPLFHPRTDSWDAHFLADQDGVIQGRTAIGRATAARLRMNHESQRAARQQWMRLGLFP